VAQVLSNISGAAQRGGAASYAQNWNWGFGRNTLDVTPQIFVQHQVADNRDPASGKRA
jgi:hypothetical protein